MLPKSYRAAKSPPAVWQVGGGTGEATSAQERGRNLPVPVSRSEETVRARQCRARTCPRLKPRASHPQPASVQGPLLTTEARFPAAGTSPAATDCSFRRVGRSTAAPRPYKARRRAWRARICIPPTPCAATRTLPTAPGAVREPPLRHVFVIVGLPDRYARRTRIDAFGADAFEESDRGRHGSGKRSAGFFGFGTGTAEPVPADQRKRAWCRRSCTLPAGNVGATRWVARRVRRTYGRRVGAHAAGVHDGGRAIYRDGIAAARHGAG